MIQINFDDISVVAEDAFRNNGQVTSLRIPSNIKKIELGAFADCTNLERLEAAEGLVCICEGAFAGCGALKEVVLPDSVRGIHAEAFRDCVSLERVVLPQGIRSVDKSCFENCVSLKEITIPADVIVVGDSAFRDCDSLERIIFHGDKTTVYQTSFEGCFHLSAKSAREIAKRFIKPLIFDIKPYADGIGGRLCPFTNRSFVFDGVACGCLESVFRSFQYPDPEEQATVCAIKDGRAARYRRLEYDWKETNTLYWRGVPYERGGAGYQALLDRLFQSVFDQDPIFRRDVGFLAAAKYRIKSYALDPAAAPVTSKEIRARLDQLCVSGGEEPLHTEYVLSDYVSVAKTSVAEHEETPPAPPEVGETRVVVLGGSFNPPTVAHLRLMRAAMAAVNAEAGVFVPSNDTYVRNKLQRQGQENDLLPEQLRLSMLLAMCAEDAGLTADDCEFGRDKQWRTYETMRALQEKNPAAKLYFIMGADKLSILPYWHHKQAFLSQFRILAVSRDGASPEALIEENEFLKKNRNAFSFMEAPEDLDGISSSVVREALKNDREAAAAMLHPAVWELLQKNDKPDFSIRCFDGPYAFLSNFYESPVTFGGLTYPTSESAYQAQKTLSGEEREAFTHYSPGKAKRVGGKVDLRPDWNEVKLGLMEEIVRAKFTQNSEIAAQLIATGDRELIEGTTWHDVYWGIDLATGQGENHLGKILMQIRHELKTGRI